MIEVLLLCILLLLLLLFDHSNLLSPDNTIFRVIIMSNPVGKTLIIKVKQNERIERKRLFSSRMFHK